MNIKELLDKNPLSKETIKKHFLEKMIDSLKSDGITEEFKEMVRKKGVEDEHIITLIDVNPRSLFDVLDENNVILNITYHDNTGWTWHVEDDFKDGYDSRKNAEISGIVKAIELLENTLKEDNKKN